ncbi:MAG: hypothetical protein HKO56_00995 [Bacteroidia bacterium]|nr:hypothetical protein [Bacteroidia bacterium]NNC85250.1 hypothetical protein [Bacteroidia bacterium]NNM15203.1 hypothetical protein [Bacteroidia bacterium]
MRKVTLVLAIVLIAFGNYSFLNSSDEVNLLENEDPVYTSHVIIKIPGFTLEQYNALSSTYMKRQDVDIEYYCLEAGILIMHYNHFGLSNADIQQSVRSELNRTIKNANIRILDVETRDENADSRC